MRRAFLILGPVLAIASMGVAQTGMVGQTAPAKPSTAAKPATAAHTAAKPTAIIDTTAGKMTCTLFPDTAPIGVANFIGLATGSKDWKNPVSGATKHNTPLYDGTIFHRVIPGFMIQGGDPAGNGTGEPGYRFKNETSPDVLFVQPGRMAYANSGPNTNGSQFFITEVPTPHLNGGYTIFGQCDEATVALVKAIAHMARDPSNDKPFRPVKITHVTIQKGGATTAARPAGTTVKKPTTATKPATSTKPTAPANPN
jgi:peptidyl-prolyl cis-trans isomerase A (cyclophilin A)